MKSLITIALILGVMVSVVKKVPSAKPPETVSTIDSMKITSVPIPSDKVTTTLPASNDSTDTTL